MKIKNIDIEKIIPYENNPRKNEKAIAPTANSIQQFGFMQPIVIDSDNVIIAGHTRYMAAKQLGLKKVPCVVAEGLTPKQIKAYRIIDNKSAEGSKWDFYKLSREISLLTVNMDGFGFNSSELEELASFTQTIERMMPETMSYEIETEKEEPKEEQFIIKKETVICPYCGTEFEV